MIGTFLKQHDYNYVRLDGKTSRKERENVLAQFDKTPGPLLMLISLRAGGVGLNCTQRAVA